MATTASTSDVVKMTGEDISSTPILAAAILLAMWVPPSMSSIASIQEKKSAESVLGKKPQISKGIVGMARSRATSKLTDRE